MPRTNALRKADSFNSSGATIVPEESDIRSTSRNPISSLSSARVLMPQDTLGRELDEALRGQQDSPNRIRRSNRLSSGNVTGDNMSRAVDSAMREYSLLPQETRSQTDLGTFLSNSNPDLAALFTNPSTSATDVLAQLQLDHPQAFLSHPTPPPIEPFRPTSAHSHHSHRSSVSASEYSFATTEMDTDEAEALEGDPNTVSPAAVHAAPMSHRGVSWGSRGMEVDEDMEDGQSFTARHAGGSKKRRGPSRYADSEEKDSPPVSEGVLRGPSHDQEDARLKRLEHRRQINRKSAQKHRMRRREELETLSRAIVEKDARIAQLERDLAVERSRTAQLQDFIDRKEGGRSGEDGRKRK